MGFETKEDTLERTIQCCKQWKMKYSKNKIGNLLDDAVKLHGYNKETFTDFYNVYTSMRSLGLEINKLEDMDYEKVLDKRHSLQSRKNI